MTAIRQAISFIESFLYREGVQLESERSDFAYGIFLVRGDGHGPKISIRVDVKASDPEAQELAILAHETGHYLGLGHVTDQHNVMHGPHLFGEVNPTSAMVNLTEDQVEEMTQHCMVVQR